LPKTFEDVDGYKREIRLLVPGYETLHEASVALLQATLGSHTGARILVVGCGSGDEVVTLAKAESTWRIDALEPSSAMTESARQAVIEHGLEDRVTIHPVSLEDFVSRRAYDAVVSILVGHFIPDDGTRARFYQQVAGLLRIGGHLILAEFDNRGAWQDRSTSAHVIWSQRAGLSENRSMLLRQRLDEAFHSLTSDRLASLLHAAGLQMKGDFFRCFGISGMLVEKRPKVADSNTGRTDGGCHAR